MLLIQTKEKTMKRRSTYLAIVLFGVLAAALSLGGCSSGPSPKVNIANADMAIERARQANAINLAPLDLKLAEEKVQQAKEASSKEKNTDASRLADEALADAQTAEAKSRATQTAQIQQQVQKDINALRREVSPPQPTPAGR
jgi:hypothetical protein